MKHQPRPTFADLLDARTDLMQRSGEALNEVFDLDNNPAALQDAADILETAHEAYEAMSRLVARACPIPIDSGDSLNLQDIAITLRAYANSREFTEDRYAHRADERRKLSVGG